MCLIEELIDDLLIHRHSLCVLVSLLRHRSDSWLWSGLVSGLAPLLLVHIWPLFPVLSDRYSESDDGQGPERTRKLLLSWLVDKCMESDNTAAISELNIWCPQFISCGLELLDRNLFKYVCAL